MRVTVRRNSRRATARWKNGLVTLNVPSPAPLPTINRILNDLAPQLLACRPTLRYTPGQRLVFPGVEFTITTQRVAPSTILATPSLPVGAIEVGCDIDMDTDAATRAISGLLCRLARRMAPDVLLPRARELAEAIDRRPMAWDISSGHRILGTCNANGFIKLSYILVFLPQELRDYVVLHELAHLSEMNHSPRFHSLLDSYLGGREQELVNALRTYPWPVLRH